MVARIVKPTKVRMVTTVKTLSTPTTATFPAALAASTTGKIVRSGEAATPKGTAIAASRLSNGLCLLWCE